MSDSYYIENIGSTPYLTKVDELLHGVGRIVVDHGNEQIANTCAENGAIYFYSPALPLHELEAFAKDNIHLYEEFSKIFNSMLSAGENVEIIPFWEKDQEWMHHKIFEQISLLTKQIIFDIKSVLAQRDLSATIINRAGDIYILITQLCHFGEGTIPLNMAPFHLRIKLNTPQYEVSAIWRLLESPEKFTFHENASPFHFEGYQSIQRESVIFTSHNKNELTTTLRRFLDAYELIGIVDAED